MSNRSRKPAHVSGGDQLRVLLVDGDQDTLDMYAESLRLSGMLGATASEPDQALALAREHRPDVMVSDIRLQRCFDGLELMERFHRDAALSSVPLLALTGFVRPTHKELAERAGCVAWLVKPCAPDVLIAEIHLAVGAMRARVSGSRGRQVWNGVPLSHRPLV
jgi:CheY-like chemotaxis protein